MSIKQSVSFPLLKFAIATDSLKAKAPSWKYEKQDLHVLFDRHGAESTDLNSFPNVTVLQGQKILERVDIASKAREADDVEREAQWTGKALNPNDLPSEFLYSRASRAIAIRYRLPESQVRRFQLKFEADRDFDHALAILQELGCKVLPGGSSQGGETSTRPTSRPLLSRDFRPGTIGSLFPDTEDASRLTSSHFHASQEGLHTIAQSPQAKRPLISSTWQRPPTPLVPIHEERAFHDDPVMQNIGGFESRVHHEPTRYQTATSGLTNALPSSAHESSRDHVFARPSSISKLTIAQLDSELRSTIPPPRELPFKTPKSRDGQASRPLSSVDLPSLPKPTYADLPANNIADGIGMQAPPSRGQSTTARPSTTAKSTAEKPSTATSTQKRASGAKITSAKASAGKSARPSTADRPMTAKSSSSQNAFQLPMTPSTIDDANGAAPTQDVRSALDRIDAAMTPQAQATVTTEADALAGYAAMAYEERMAVLEELIVNAVDDENFITLVEDVSGCWQRIGLGR